MHNVATECQFSVRHWHRRSNTNQFSHGEDNSYLVRSEVLATLRHYVPPNEHGGRFKRPECEVEHSIPYSRLTMLSVYYLKRASNEMKTVEY